MFSLITLQYIVQTNLVKLFSEKNWFIDSVNSSIIPFLASCALLFLVFILSSTFSAKLRSLPAMSIPLLLLYSISWSCFVLIGSILLFEKAAMQVSMIASVMQMSVCMALSLYACCLKEHFSTGYSHL